MAEGKQTEAEVRVRPAVLEDWQAIAELNIRLADETEGKRLDALTIEAGVKELLANAHHGRYFVACHDSRIVGQMMHTREWSDWRNGEIWWLQSVYVLPDYRRSGVFRALYRHLEQLAEATPRIVGLRLYVEQQNSKAFEAYQALGLTDAGYNVMERMFVKLPRVNG